MAAETLQIRLLRILVTLAPISPIFQDGEVPEFSASPPRRYNLLEDLTLDLQAHRWAPPPPLTKEDFARAAERRAEVIAFFGGVQ